MIKTLFLMIVRQSGTVFDRDYCVEIIYSSSDEDCDSGDKKTREVTESWTTTAKEKKSMGQMYLTSFLVILRFI